METAYCLSMFTTTEYYYTKSYFRGTSYGRFGLLRGSKHTEEIVSNNQFSIPTTFIVLEHVYYLGRITTAVLKYCIPILLG